MAVFGGVGEFYADGQLALAGLDAADDDGFDAQFPGDGFQVRLLALVTEDGAAGDDLQVGQVAELVDEAFREAVREVVHLRVVAGVHEGEHRDGIHGVAFPHPDDSRRARAGQHQRQDSEEPGAGALGALHGEVGAGGSGIGESSRGPGLEGPGLGGQFHRGRDGVKLAAAEGLLAALEVGHHVVGAGVAVLPVLGQGLAQDAAQFRVDGRGIVPQQGGFEDQDGAHEFGAALGLEGPLARNHLVEHRS